MHLHARLPWGSRTERAVPRSSQPPSQNDDSTPGSNTPLIIIGIVVPAIVIVFVAIVLVRRWRRQRGASPDWAQQGTWARFWGLFSSQGRRYQAASGDDSAELNGTSRTNRRDVEQASRSAARGSAIDRNTSVRSVLTLPAYSRSASNTEQVIGREGDRDGVDVIVDFPTEEDEEALREREMDALYQLRATRRQQIEDRDELRRQRRDARERNDLVALADIRSRTRAASNSNQTLVEDLRRDIGRARENRQRSVSSVSYADLGVARHDGTRLRASSQESERMGLLSDAADMGHLTRSRADSSTSHHRGRSASSVLSMESEMPSATLTQTRGSSRAAASRPSSGGPWNGSSPELVESDLGVEAMPPPEYDNVPLDDDGGSRRESISPLNEPPPHYQGPYRSGCQHSQRSQFEDVRDEATADAEPQRISQGRGVGGIPQLPSLRISRLPEIVVEPSSAHPRESNDEGDVTERH